MADVQYATPLPIYVIFEEVYAGVFGMDKFTVDGKSILGFTLDKITRHILQVAAETEYYQGGQKVEGVPSFLSYVKDFVGYEKFEAKLTGKRSYILVYAGIINEIESFGYRKQLPQAMSISYGKDPIPNIHLYGNEKVIFSVPAGGRGRAQAMAYYDAQSGQMSVVPPDKKDEVLKSLLATGKYGK